MLFSNCVQHSDIQYIHKNTQIKQQLFSFFANLQTFWYTIFRYKRLGFPARQVLKQLHSNFQIDEHNERNAG